MVKNNIGGSKSKKIGSKFTKKKITAENPDFENSFFAVVVKKPDGFMCTVKICLNEKVEKIMKEKDLNREVHVNIGKLKHDKRNNSINPGDIVQVEFSFDMKRQNGNYYGCILCKYDAQDIKYFKRAKLLVLECDDETMESEDIFDYSSEEDKPEIQERNVEYPEVSLDVDLDDL
jgi:hypothetical protein